MNFARLAIGGMGVFVLVLLVALGISGCDNDVKTMGANGGQTAHYTDVTLPCVKSISVDRRGPNGLIRKHQAVYVCDGDIITWVPNDHETFHLEFSKECPFVVNGNDPCPVIGNDKPGLQLSGGPVKTHDPLDGLRVYKYVITVEGKQSADPHVVGGGR